MEDSDDTLVSKSQRLNADKAAPQIISDSDSTFVNNDKPEAPMQGGQFEPGTILERKYKIISVLGKGGMGTVYRVEQILLEQQFALKTLLSVDEVQIKRFRMEAKAALSLKHPNLVQVHDFGILESGEPYLVMELVEGITLAEHIKRFGPLSMNNALAVFAQACAGLSEAHKQSVVHRDIKPSNIMLENGRPLGAEGSVKIFDFGIAKMKEHEGGVTLALTKAGEVFGSPLYMSPEQCSGELIDHRSDIYSIGCSLFEALTGTPPHVGSNTLMTISLHQNQKAPRLKEASLGMEFPLALEQMVQKLLDKDPEQRYQNLDHVSRDLNAIKNGLTIDSKPALSKPKSEKGMIISIVAAFVIAVGVFVCYMGQKPVASTDSSTVTTSKTSVSVNSHSVGGSNSSKSADSADTTDISSKVDSDSGADDIAADLEKFSHNSPVVFAEFQKAYAQAELSKTRIYNDEFGHKWQEVMLPSKPVGQFIFDMPDGQTLQRVQRDAQGKLQAPASQPLTLDVDGKNYPEALSIPSVFKKIDPDTFAKLVLESRSTQNLSDGPKDAVTQEVAVPEILEAVADWSKLKTLNIWNLPLDKRSLAAINKMHYLSSVKLNGHDFDPELISRQPFLVKLEYINLAHFPADKIVRALSKSPKLQQLFLDDISLTAPSIELLEKCPKLTSLTVWDKGDAAITEALAKLQTSNKGLKIDRVVKYK